MKIKSTMKCHSIPQMAGEEAKPLKRSDSAGGEKSTGVSYRAQHTLTT